MDENNLYMILNLEKDCSKEDIKKSFKKLAVKYHPDKNNNSDYSKKKFIKIKEAFDILYDDIKRKKYDEKNIHKGVNIFDGKNIFEIKELKKFKDFFNIFSNPVFYLLFFDKLSSSNTNFIYEMITSKKINFILDINETINFNIYEVYNNMSKLFIYFRNTRENFEEYISPIDLYQSYEKEGEIIEINNIKYTGNLNLKINITSLNHNNNQYYLMGNDLCLFIKKQKIKNNIIKIKFLDDKKYIFYLDLDDNKKCVENTKETKNLKKINLNKLKNEDNSYTYYTKNMGLPYINTKQEIININEFDYERGNLFFILS